MKRFLPLMYVALLLILLCPTARTQTMDAVRVERNTPLRMSDGAVLKADIYHPATTGKFPVLLQRTPYNKSSREDFGRRAATQGYVVVVQDVGGRFASEGEWYPFQHEGQDGYETIEWAAGLPDSNGKVGMFGGSYVGVTQMLAAIKHPPHLAGICPYVTASNYHEGWTYLGGAFAQWFNESWTTGLARDTVDRILAKSVNSTIGAKTLPLQDYPILNLEPGFDLSKAAAPYFQDWLAHPSYDDYWKQWAIEEHYGDIQVPALNIAAWYDLFQGGSIRNYIGMRDHAGNDSARKGQRLIVVIGGHSGSGQKIGDIDFGASAVFSEDDTTLAWYDFLFKGVQNQFAGNKPVKLFVMGTNTWREEEAWPLKRAPGVKYYLHSSGKAAGPTGEGVLSAVVPADEPADSYSYDPLNPVPTTGGPLSSDAKTGPQDQRLVEQRPDVMLYTTPVLAADTEVTGPVSAELYASSSAVDTDFTAKLVDVWPNGYAQNLTEGILRARYLDSPEKPNLLKPGEIRLFKIDMWSTSNVFLKGHRIRVEISSSNFPRFDRNLNTGNDPKSDRSPITAQNTIKHDKEHPSAIVLPIVER